MAKTAPADADADAGPSAGDEQAPRPVLTLHPQSLCVGCVPAILNAAGRCRFLTLDDQLLQREPVTGCGQFRPPAAPVTTTTPDVAGETAESAGGSASPAAAAAEDGAPAPDTTTESTAATEPAKLQES